MNELRAGSRENDVVYNLKTAWSLRGLAGTDFAELSSESRMVQSNCIAPKIPDR
jgi:hypothetical protein